MSMSDSTEEWKDIPGYEGRYQASSLGRIKSLARSGTRSNGRIFRTVEKILRQSKSGQGGYSMVCLSDSSLKQRLCLVHRLVLQTFVGPCPAGMQACHSPDRDRKNNQLENLRWATVADNAHDRELHGTVLTGSKNPASKLTEEDVRKIRSMYKKNEFGFKRIAKLFNVGHGHIMRIITGQRWEHLPKEED